MSDSVYRTEISLQSSPSTGGVCLRPPGFAFGDAATHRRIDGGERRDVMFVSFHWPVSATVPVSVSVRRAPSHCCATKAGVQRRTAVFCNPTFLVPSCLRRRLSEMWKKPDRNRPSNKKNNNNPKRTAFVNWTARGENEALKFQVF